MKIMERTYIFRCTVTDKILRETGEFDYNKIWNMYSEEKREKIKVKVPHVKCKIKMKKVEDERGRGDEHTDDDGKFKDERMG